MNRWCWALVFLVSIGLRLFVASLGHNSDVYAFFQTARYVADGEVVYAVYRKYNYGPIWSYILGGIVELMRLFGPLKIFNFHLILAGLLSLVDIALAVWLKRRAGTTVALIFLFSPVSILLTGYHSQFDSIAVFLALLAWDMIVKQQIVAGSLVLGLSLSMKHIFFMFPIWALFVTGIGALHKRLLVPLISFSLFLLLFIPFMIDPDSRAGVVKNVFKYTSRWTGNSLLYDLTAHAVKFFQVPEPVYETGIKFLFMGCLLGFGIVFARRGQVKDMAVWYCAALFVTASAVAHQYLAIPLVACALFYRSIWPWVYTALVVLVLLTSKSNLGALETFGDWKIRGIVPSSILQLTMLGLIIWGSGMFKIGQKPAASL